MTAAGVGKYIIIIITNLARPRVRNRNAVARVVVGVPPTLAFPVHRGHGAVCTFSKAYSKYQDSGSLHSCTSTLF